MKRRDFLVGLLASACSRAAREKPVDTKIVPSVADPPPPNDAAPTRAGAELVDLVKQATGQAPTVPEE